MSDNKKSPDNNNDVSPIRGLFRQNEEAYNKHQQKVAEEKKRISDELNEQENTEKRKHNESENNKDGKSQGTEPPLGEKVKSFFGKIAEIITQPEDGAFFSDNSDGFEDIYSDKAEENGSTAAKRHNDIKISEENHAAANPDDSFRVLSDNRVRYDNEKAEYNERESVIYRKSEDISEPPNNAVNESEQDAAVSLGVTDIVEDNNKKAAAAVSDDNVQSGNVQEKLVENQEADKTEITLEAVMYAKNSGTEGVPVAYNVNKPNADITENKRMPESTPEREDVVISAEKVAAEKTAAEKVVAEKSVEETAVEETASEPVHNKLSEDDEPTAVKRVNELAHDISEENLPNSTPKRFNELSHDVNTEVKAQNIPNTKNELSHNTDVAANVNEKSAAANINKKTVKKTDFSEGKSGPMVYRRSSSPEFVVMAGKFTKTLRSEYEDTRRIRGCSPVTSVKEKETNEKPARVEKKTPKKEKIRPEKGTAEKDTKASDNSDENSKILPLTIPKKKKHFRIKDLFSAEEDTFDEDEEENEEKPEITDYNDKDDISAIRNEINYNFRNRFLRTCILLALSLASLITTLLVQIFPSLFLETIDIGWLLYGFLNFAYVAAAVFIEKSTIFCGLAPLRHFKATSDTAVSVALSAAVIQSVTGLFLPNVFVNGTYHMYSFLAIIALFFNSAGKLMIIKRTAENFKFLCSKNATHAGKIFTDNGTAVRFISGLSADRPIIAYAKKSKFMSNFLQLSYTSDPIEDSAAFLAPFAAVVSLMIGVVYGLLANDFVGGVSSFALFSFVTTPICALIALNIPIKKLCSSTLRKGAMVVGYEAIKQFGDTNAVMIDSNQLYPKGCITLSGIKAFNETKLNTALLAGAAVNFAVDGPMSHIFETVIQDRRNMVPVVESVSYDDNLGLSGWIGGQRVLIGNRGLMIKHNINVPDESLEKKYRKMGNEISYISMSGELIAMFILKYKTDRKIANALAMLTKNNVNIIIRTIDPNITQEHISEKFGILQRCVKVLNTGLGNVCHEELQSSENRTRAYVVTDGSLTAFASAICGSIEVKPTVTIAKVMQILTVTLGLVFFGVICFVSGFAELSGLAVMCWAGFWGLALIIISIFARKA